MATEIELKLTLSPHDARTIAGHPLLNGQPGRQRRLLNTYYDTPDLALKARRVALRFRQIGKRWLLTVKSAEPASGGLAVRNEWECPASPGVFDFAHVDAAELRADLEAARDALVPVFTTDFKRTTWTVAYGNSQIEVALDRGRIASQERRTALCELELELLAGDIADLFAFTRELQNHFHLQPAVASKAERGYALFCNEAPRPTKARPLQLAAELTPVEAFRRVALACLEQLQRNETGIRTTADPEYVHQARVALRRLRSALKIFAPLLPAEFITAYSGAWQTLAATLGTARNWEVFVGETLPPIAAAFPPDPALDRLRREGRRRARQARAAVAAMLGLPEYPRLLVEFTAALYALPLGGDSALTDFALQCLCRRCRQARKLAARNDTLDPAARHILRIRFKKLRYTLEFFSALLPQRHLAPYLTALARLQDELGRINDHVTAETLVAEVLGKRQAGPVHGWIAGRHALLLEELPDALETWLEQPIPWKFS